MGLTKDCLRCLLIITNILLIIIAIICLGFGIFMMTTLSRVVKKFLEPSLENVNTITKRFDYLQGSGSNAVDDAEIDVTPLVEPLAIFLIVIGIVLIVIAVLGFFGACCDSRLLLAVYSIVLAAVILVQLIMIILFFSKALDGSIRRRAENKLIEPYTGITGYSASTLVANAVMYRYQCCGIDGYEDFSKAKDWKRIYTVTRDRRRVTVNLTTPVVCCKIKIIQDVCDVVNTCAEAPSGSNSNWHDGCWDKVTQELDEHKGSAVGVVVVILIVEVVFLVIALVIICLLRNNRVL